jgi:hypothetical protein
MEHFSFMTSRSMQGEYRPNCAHTVVSRKVWAIGCGTVSNSSSTETKYQIMTGIFCSSNQNALVYMDGWLKTTLMLG